MWRLHCVCKQLVTNIRRQSAGTSGERKKIERSSTNTVKKNAQNRSEGRGFEGLEVHPWKDGGGANGEMTKEEKRRSSAHESPLPDRQTEPRTDR